MTTAINARDGDGIRVWKCDVGHTDNPLPCYKVMSEMKRRKSSEQGNPEASSDSLLKTSKKGDIELTEKELGMVTGGTDKTPLTETISLSFAKVNVEYKP